MLKKKLILFAIGLTMVIALPTAVKAETPHIPYTPNTETTTNAPAEDNKFITKEDLSNLEKKLEEVKDMAKDDDARELLNSIYDLKSQADAQGNTNQDQIKALYDNASKIYEKVSKGTNESKKEPIHNSTVAPASENNSNNNIINNHSNNVESKNHEKQEVNNETKTNIKLEEKKSDIKEEIKADNKTSDKQEDKVVANENKKATKNTTNPKNLINTLLDDLRISFKKLNKKELSSLNKKRINQLKKFLNSKDFTINNKDSKKISSFLKKYKNFNMNTKLSDLQKRDKKMVKELNKIIKEIKKNNKLL